MERTEDLEIEDSGKVARIQADARSGSGSGEALRSGDSRAGALLAALLDPTVVIDAHGTIQAASDSVHRVFGYAPAELVGLNVNVLMPEPYRSAHDAHLERYRRTGQTSILGRTREFEVVRKDGSTIQVDLSVARAEMPDGAGPHFIGSFRDVTERKRAEQALRDSERRFRALFDGAFEFVGLLRPDGTVLEANRKACEAGGLAREDVVGRRFWETRWWSHSKEAQDRIRDAVRTAAAGEFVRFEIPQRARGGELLDIDFSLTPIKDESGQVVLLIPEGRDVTALKAAQRAETTMLRALATIGESAAMLAHEIKNPITAVNLALRAVAEKLGEDQRTVLEDLAGRMQHLERLMRTTLSFARPLQPKLVQCDARELLERTVARLGPLLARNGSQIETELTGRSLRFRADPGLLEEVLSNLVTNAIEAKGSAARVLLAAARSPDGAVLLSVDDDGPGIAPERRDSIFKPYVTTKAGGTGLGLAICRKIVEEHGGTIRVEDGRLGGARFAIRLPSGSTRIP